MSNASRASAPEEELPFGPLEYAGAVLNILEDSEGERTRLLDTQRATLNILDDFGAERARLLETQKAVLNILDDLAAEKERLEIAQKEILRSEQALRQSLSDKEVLLKEIHHRVKNNLQVISSLLVLQARYLADPEARDILNDSQSRVRSIALVHEKLYRSADLTHVELGDYFETLTENLFQTYNTAARGISKVVDVRTRMTIDAAIPCGLMMNELVTNSLKHAFPAGRTGTVRIFARDTDAGLEMVVEDDGVGLPEHLDPRGGRSLGLDLVFTLAQQLNAKVEVVRTTGTCFRFMFGGPGGADGARA